MKTIRCGNCGSLNVKIVENKGPFNWKDYPSVLLYKGLPLHTCQECQEIITPGSMAVVIDRAIEETITKSVVSFISTILQREKTLQKDLSDRLGVSPEYLSEIKSGRKFPSFQTFNFLKVLAMDKTAYANSDPKKHVKVG